jgi:hypothetical protein
LVFIFVFNSAGGGRNLGGNNFGGNNFGGGGNNFGGGGGGSAGASGTCYACGEPGHFAPNCPNKNGMF